MLEAVASYRIDVEVMEDNTPNNRMNSSSESNGEPPMQKKARPNEHGPKSIGAEGRDKSKAVDGQTSSLSAKLRAIADSTRENDIEMEECDSSWAEMDEETINVDSDDGKEMEAQPMEGINENGRATNKKNGLFSEETENRRTKRGGPPHPNGKKKGESSATRNDNPETIDDDNLSDDELFANIVAKNKWKKMGKNNKVVTPPKTKRHSLKGVKSTLQKEYYVQGLDYEGLNNYTEMEELIQAHCTRRGVLVTFMKIIPTKFDKSQVGCKLDAEKVTNEEFWPESTTGSQRTSVVTVSRTVTDTKEKRSHLMYPVH